MTNYRIVVSTAADPRDVDDLLLRTWPVAKSPLSGNICSQPGPVRSDRNLYVRFHDREMGPRCLARLSKFLTIMLALDEGNTENSIENRNVQSWHGNCLLYM